MPGCVQKVELGCERGLIMALRSSEAHVDRLTAEVERLRQLVAEAWSEGYSDGVGDGQGYSSGRAKFADSDAKRALAETL